MNKGNDVDTFCRLLEFAAGCFLAGMAVGIVLSVIFGLL